MMTAQAIAQAPCYFFNPESKQDGRQHGHFQPSMQQMMYPTVPMLPSTPAYSRPNSACSQLQGQAHPGNPQGAVMTPIASPQSLSQKPTIMVETEIRDDMYYPSTPPLSTSGSAVGSPNSCDVLQTPMNPMFSGLDGMAGLKETFEATDSFAVDLANTTSPPLTPGKTILFPVITAPLRSRKRAILSSSKVVLGFDRTDHFLHTLGRAMKAGPPFSPCS